MMNKTSVQAITIMLNGFQQSAAADKQALLLTYGRALSGVSDQAITEAAQRYVSGSVPGQNTAFAPSVAEFSQEARRIAEDDARRSQLGGRRLFMYRRPSSKLLERNVAKDFAFRLIDQGVHPRGSIWCPGTLDNRPDIGDLFGPDPNWKQAIPVNPTVDHKPYQPDEARARIRMGFKMSLLSKAISMNRVDDVAQANREGMDSLMALAQQWNVTIPEELWSQPRAA